MRCMEVDHFDYRQKKDRFQRYDNLFLATRHCNGAKLQKPTAKELAAGLRLLNPCKEWDYGPHIVENPDTHQLVGLTPLGKYQVRTCDLNAEHLVLERSERAEIWRLVRRNNGVTVRSNSALDDALAAIEALRKQVEHMIPELPLLDKGEANAPGQ
jgi:hypothetical protein